MAYARHSHNDDGYKPINRFFTESSRGCHEVLDATRDLVTCPRCGERHVAGVKCPMCEKRKRARDAARCNRRASGQLPSSDRAGVGAWAVFWIVYGILVLGLAASLFDGLSL